MLPAAAGALALAAGAPQPLPALDIDPARIFSQGASSGGDMAVQFHTSFSSRVSGLCGDDAQPFRCAATRFAGDALLPQTPESSVPHCLGCPDGMTIAYDHCKNHGHWVNTSRLDAVARALPACGGGDPLRPAACIDPLPGLGRSRVLVTRGECRTYTGNAVQNTQDVYTLLSSGAANITYFDRCNPDGSKKSDDVEAMCFDKVLDARSKGIPNPLHLVTFDQTPFITDVNVGFAATGLVYIPKKCRSAGAACALQVRFGGCGFPGVPLPTTMELAEGSGVVVLAPTIAQGNNATDSCNAGTPVAGNCQEIARACWDGYGQLSAGYVLQDAPHMHTVWRMVAHLAGLPQ